MKEIKLTRKVAEKVLKVVDAGLVSGLGKAKPGQMCVEAAVCYALGLPHGDNPPCVGESVRSFKISLNDCKWPTDEDRTKGMRKLAIAQLGSNEIDQTKFLEIVGFKCITQILPVIVQNAITEDKDNDFCKKQNKELKPMISKLKKAKDFEEAEKLAEKVWDIYASASAYASDYASAYASAYASDYAYAYASASAYASAYASDYASAYASDYASAYAYREKNPIFNLQVLNMTTQAGLEALIELKSPGCEWLDLCD